MVADATCPLACLQCGQNALLDVRMKVPGHGAKWGPRRGWLVTLAQSAPRRNAGGAMRDTALRALRSVTAAAIGVGSIERDALTLIRDIATAQPAGTDGEYGQTAEHIIQRCQTFLREHDA